MGDPESTTGRIVFLERHVFRNVSETILSEPNAILMLVCQGETIACTSISNIL